MTITGVTHILGFFSHSKIHYMLSIMFAVVSLCHMANKNVADYLDVTFDMKKESFKPFTKPNHTPRYVHMLSNHPPAIIKNIPLSVNDRLNRLSSTREIFEAAAPLYQRALEASGYEHKLEYRDMVDTATRTPGICRGRSRKVNYFNPPFS